MASPASVISANDLGGRVLTVQYNANMYPLHRYSEARRAWLIAALGKLGGQPPFISGEEQDMMVLVRRRQDGGHLVLAENLNSDPVRRLSFISPLNVHGVERLMGDGSWRQVGFSQKDGRLSCDVQLAFYEAAVLRVR